MPTPRQVHDSKVDLMITKEVEKRDKLYSFNETIKKLPSDDTEQYYEAVKKI